jgi:hypothetical protein
VVCRNCGCGASAGFLSVGLEAHWRPPNAAGTRRGHHHPLHTLLRIQTAR